MKNQVQLASSTWDAVHQGMRNVVAYSAGSDELINRINVHVAGKTGTAQESEDKPDHALFVSYAPYESPEVSVTCVTKMVIPPPMPENWLDSSMHTCMIQIN